MSLLRKFLDRNKPLPQRQTYKNGYAWAATELLHNHEQEAIDPVKQRLINGGFATWTTMTGAQVVEHYIHEASTFGDYSDFDRGAKMALIDFRDLVNSVAIRTAEALKVKDDGTV